MENYENEIIEVKRVPKATMVKAAKEYNKRIKGDKVKSENDARNGQKRISEIRLTNFVRNTK